MIINTDEINDNKNIDLYNKANYNSKALLQNISLFPHIKMQEEKLS